MDKLPEDVLIQIAALIPRTPRRPRGSRGKPVLIRPGLATLSRGWQYAIERVTFRSIHIGSDELDTFLSIFSEERGAHRRHFVQRLDFDIVLDPYSQNAYAYYETDRDRAANDKTASFAVSTLLRELSKWPANNELGLNFDMYSPTDPPLEDLEDAHMNQRRRHRLARRRGARNDLEHKRYKYSYVQLSDIDDLRVPCIHTFQLKSGYGFRHIHPGSQAKLTAAFPQLVYFTWTFDAPRIFLALHRKVRAEFASDLEGLQLSPAIKTVEFHMPGPSFDQYKQLTDLAAAESQDSDPLCAKLHEVISSGKMTSLDIRTQIDPSFFWPNPSGNNSHWESITKLMIQFDPIAPSGKCYLKSSRHNAVPNRTNREPPPPPSTTGFVAPGYGEPADTKAALAFESWMEDANATWRRPKSNLVNEEVMVPMLEAYARCLAHMPTLESADLYVDPWTSEGRWSVSYHVPPKLTPELKRMLDRLYNFPPELQFKSHNKHQRQPPKPEPYDERPYFKFTVGSWRVKDHLLQLFRQVGKERHEREPVLKFQKA